MGKLGNHSKHHDVLEHEGHNHPNLAIRLENLTKIMLALEKAGTKLSPEGGYVAGYVAYNKKHKSNTDHSDGWDMGA